MRIVELEHGKKRLEFVAGLVWHPLQSTGSARAKELLGYAQEQGCDLKATRLQSSPHVGLTKKSDGGKPGQLSIAAAIADSLAEAGYRNCLVALPLPDDPAMCVFLAVRDGVILADGDVVSSAEDIRNRLVGDVSYGGWDCIICPPEWAINDSKDRTLVSFLEVAASGNMRPWRLQETVVNWKKFAIPAVVALVLAAAGAYGWGQYQQKKFLAAEALRLQQEELERSQKAVAVQGPPKPWLSMPGAMAFVQGCTQAYRSANLNGGNWLLGDVTCENNTLTIRWSRSSETAWISHLQAMQPAAVITDDATSATLSLPAKPIPPIDSATTPLPGKNVNLRYQELASRLGFVISMNAPKVPVAPPPLPGQTAGEVAAPATPWTALPIAISSKLEPVVAVRLLDHPGLRLTRLDFLSDAGVLKYKLTGVQYVSLQ